MRLVAFASKFASNRSICNVASAESTYTEIVEELNLGELHPVTGVPNAADDNAALLEEYAGIRR